MGLAMSLCLIQESPPLFLGQQGVCTLKEAEGVVCRSSSHFQMLKHVREPNI